MSLFNAMNTAVSGLGAQSSAFNNISQDVANSQTVGFKRVDTNFAEYLATSNAHTNVSGPVVATPFYANSVQGSLQSSDATAAVGISGGTGFFAVSQPVGSANTSGAQAFSNQQYYTRAGDFSLDSRGYLVNSAGYYLNGYGVSQSTTSPGQNVVNQTLAPIQVNEGVLAPTPTSNVYLSANLPATPTAGTATAANPLTSDITAYDAQGNAQNVTLNWSQTGPSAWSVDVQVPGSGGPTDLGTMALTFNPNGTLNTIAAGSSSTITTNGTSNLVLPSSTDLGAMTINFGTASNPTGGLTQYSGSSYNLLGLTQDGSSSGNFTGITMQSNGNVLANYDNGQIRTVAQIPLVTFNNPDALQSQNGQAYTASNTSGTPLVNNVGVGQAGSLTAGEVEGSNVDIASEFSQLIVAQQAYSANAKIVTTSDQMLQVTMNMKS